MASGAAYETRLDDPKLPPRQLHPKGLAQSRYEHLSQDREPYLQRARACSKLTIPYLIPPDNMAEGQALPTPFQSVGAAGVTNLAAKLLMSMIPPNEPCFRLRVDNLELEKILEQEDKEARTMIERSLSRIEQAVVGDIEVKGDRPVVYEGNQHLLVGGNILYHDDEEKGLRLIPLSQFVTDRAPNGQVVEIVVQEKVDIRTLPAALAQALEAVQQSHGGAGEEEESSKGKRKKEKAGESLLKKDAPARRAEEDEELEVYTRIALEDDDKWHVFQECRGQVVEGTTGTYRRHECPWIPVRMYHVAGENYGRSYVESVLGDLRSLESLSQAVVEAAAMSAKVTFMVNPNSFTSPRALAEMQNGAIIEGNAADVTVLQVQKQADLQVAFQQIQVLTDRLRTAFLMVDGIRRNAERVTAEEIRIMAQELEAALGGVYTVISQEFQLPYISGRIALLQDEGKLPQLPGDMVRPSIVTGFEALGRGNDKQKLIEFLGIVAQSFGEAAMPLLNPSNAIYRLAASMGINPEGLVKDEETLAAEQQQQQAMMQQQQVMDMAKTAGPEIVRQVGASGMLQPTAEE